VRWNFSEIFRECRGDDSLSFQITYRKSGTQEKYQGQFFKIWLGGPKTSGGPWTRESPGGIARGGRVLQDGEKISALPST